MFASTRGVTASAVGALRYTAQQRAAPFSVRQRVRGIVELAARKQRAFDCGLMDRFLTHSCNDVSFGSATSELGRIGN
jgi:hypothetical protein